MLTKAYIQEVLSSHSIRVRIPLYNKIEGVEGATPNNELHTACVCTLPNFITNPKAGDVVIVGFEENDVSNPVILGYLSTSSTNQSLVDVLCDSLTVKGDTLLDEYTTIGEVKPENIKCLKDLKENINESFKKNTKNIEDIYSKINANGVLISENSTDIEDLKGYVDTEITSLSNDINDIITTTVPALEKKLNNRIIISKEKPTLETVGEGQVYLWVQN